jgi:hypothetical protein
MNKPTFPARVKILSGVHAGEFGVAELRGDKGNLAIFLDDGHLISGDDCEIEEVKPRSLED